ncbi:MAG: hypothetical protein HRU20_00410 [Pseudomonadales bacterium]|nr:hypothetical protein [Pseudomonadales bacterium]
MRIRDLLRQGKPILTTYPCMVLAPYEPKLAESNSAIIKFITSIMPITSSGVQFVDARDVVIAHRLLLEADIADDKTCERYIIGGHFYNWAEIADLVGLVAVKTLLKILILGNVCRALGVAFDLCRKLFPIKHPISAEAMNIVSYLPALKK